MKTYVQINDQKIQATVYGRSRDTDWGDRESKEIRTAMTYEQAKALFADNAPWSIVQEFGPVQQADGSTITPEPVVYDNADYCMAGPITDYRDGTIGIKMGKHTELEKAQKDLNDIIDAYTEGVNSL